MIRRFIMMVDDATAQQQDAVTKYLKTTDHGFWHYFSDCWLITDHSDTLTCDVLRDEVNRIMPGKTTLVVQMDNPTQWAGFGQTEHFKWVNEVWNNP
jgi:hypothetical protein